MISKRQKNRRLHLRVTMKDDKNLYQSMMKAIGSKHSRSDAVSFFKLPMIFSDSRLYGGAIGQFYLITSELESMIEKKIGDGSEILKDLKENLQLKPLSPGYESDLIQLFGSNWKNAVERAKTSPTEEYLVKLKKATEVELCSAAFILYGALVIGGGRTTQRRVKKVLRNCDHILFDVSDNMLRARKRFKDTFRLIGERYPQHFDEFVANAGKFMSRNNRVVLSIRCLPFWWIHAAGILAITAIGISVATNRQPSDRISN